MTTNIIRSITTESSHTGVDHVRLQVFTTTMPVIQYEVRISIDSTKPNLWGRIDISAIGLAPYAKIWTNQLVDALPVLVRTSTVEAWVSQLGLDPVLARDLFHDAWNALENQARIRQLGYGAAVL